MKNKVLTLLLVLNKEKNEILLGMKKRGFGVGKWNGFGGKISSQETILEAAQRELKEEAGITAINPFFLGLISFEFKNEPEIMQVHLFKAYNYEGEVTESEEMKPRWFSLDKIPFDKMWKDDSLWFPYMLEDKNFYGYFLFEGHEKILDFKLNELNFENLIIKQKEIINHPI